MFTYSSARSDRILTHIGLHNRALRVLAGSVTAGQRVRAGGGRDQRHPTCS